MPASGPAFQAAGTSAMADNVASTLCYVLGFITGIIFLVLAPYNKNRLIRFHAFQSIFISVAFIALRMVAGILIGAMGLFSFFFVYSLISLAGFIFWIYMLLMTYQGKKIVLPVIGPIAEQQAGA